MALIGAGCDGTSGADGALDATLNGSDGSIAVADAGPDARVDIGAVGPAGLDASPGGSGDLDAATPGDADTGSTADSTQPDADGSTADTALGLDAADTVASTDGTTLDADDGGSDTTPADTAVEPDPCPSQPLPDASGPDAPPKPDESKCTLPAPKFFVGPLPAETLVPVLGVRSFKGYAWSPLQDGAWLGMHVGPQGSFHVFSAYRVEVKGVKGPYAKMQVETWLSDGCTQIAKGQKPISYDYPVFGKKGSYGNSEKGEVGTLVVFGNPAVDVPKFCGRWARLHVRVKHQASGAWGSTSRLVRLYDAGKK